MNSAPNYPDCGTCGGREHILCGTCQERDRQERLARAREADDRVLCVNCDGFGSIEAHECARCHGTGWMEIVSTGWMEIVNDAQAENDDSGAELGTLDYDPDEWTTSEQTHAVINDRVLAIEGDGFGAALVLNDIGELHMRAVTLHPHMKHYGVGASFKLTEAQIVHAYRILGAYIYSELDPALLLDADKKAS